MTRTAIDFSAAFPSAAAVRAAGHEAVIGYFSDSRPGANFGAKPMSRAAADAYRAGGVDLVTNYQYGKGDTSDWRGGFDAGVRHGKRCLDLHFAAGGPPFRPLYAPCDSSPSLAEYNAMVAPFLKGWASVVGLDWTGVYGNSLVHAWAQQDGLATWFWLHNWGGDQTPTARTHLHQVRIDKDTVDGIGVDLSETLRDDYGQWSKAVAPAPVPIPAPLDTGGTMQVQLSPNNSGNGSLQNPIWLVVHTAQGATTDESLANYIGNSANQVSYHYLVDDDSLTRCLNEDQQAWAALGANRFGIHFCTTGFVAWSRDEWLKHPNMLNMLGDVMADVGRRHGIDGEHLTDDQIRQHVMGTIGHGDYARATRDGDHTDPLPDFPWDYLAARMAGQPTAPPAAPALPPLQGAIADHYRNTPGLADLLGAPTPNTEFPAPDGVGRYTHFERGSIYWHPDTGAFSVLGAIRDEWARNHWELGPLGYPLSDEFQSDYERQSNFQHGWIGWSPNQAAHVHF